MFILYHNGSKIISLEVTPIHTAQGGKFLIFFFKSLYYVCLGTIGLIVKTSILPSKLLGQIFLLRTSNFRGETITR